VTTPELAAAPAVRACPKCAAALVTEGRAEPWCERCEWGLDVYVPPVGTGRTSRWLGRLSHRVAYRATTSQFRGLQQAPPTRAGFRAVRLAVVGISLVLMALTLGLAAGGVWLILLNPNVATIVVGGAAILVAIGLVPPVGRFNRDYRPLPREEAATLYAVVDRLAAAVGTRAPYVIAVSPDYNASVSAYGLRRRRVLYLGLAMWGVLTPQQRVALLGHELGHFVNGDIRKWALARPAMITLGRLARLLTPDHSRRRFRGLDLLASRSSGFVFMGEMLMRVIMWPVAAGLTLAQLGILALVLRDGQRAEYLADLGAARLAGTSAAVELVDLLVQREGGHTVVTSQARAGGGVEAWRTAIAEMRERQTPARLHRLRQLTVRRDSSLLATHPPRGLRARLLESAAWTDPTFVLTADESDHIDAELAAYYKRFRRDIAQTQV
jgi:heat shock protein HtpX